jgi:hypothetical protein
MDTDAMVLEMMPAVEKIVRKMRLPSEADAEDLVSAGVLAVVQAANEYDETRGVPWKAFATQKAKWAVTEEATKQIRRGDVNTLRRAGGGGVHVPTTPDPADVAEAREVVLTGRVGKIAAALPPPCEVAERVTKLREAMYGRIKTEDVEAVMDAVLTKAKAGNTGAAKLIVDMLSPGRGGTKVVQQQAVFINGEDIG